MFQIDDDMTIYITRGDIAYFSVMAENDGVKYKFQPGDVVRMKVTAKKDCTNVAFQKDFAVIKESEKVDILLTEEETKIGDVISKPVDYWYEIELNPYTNPQTIIGYDDDGAKIFKLFPEGKDLGPNTVPEDVPVVDAELSLTSQKPVENQAITRAVTQISEDVNAVKKSGSEAVATLEAKMTEATNKVFARVGELDGEIAVERARINNLAANTGEQTEGNAELIDMRVGADGTVYETAGEAVRGQTGNLKRGLSEVENDIYTEAASTLENYLPYGKEYNAYVSTDGNTYTSEIWKHYEFEVSEGEEFYVYTYSVPVAPAVVFLNNNTAISFLPENISSDGELVDIRFYVPKGANKMKINVCTNVTPPTIQKALSKRVLKSDVSNILYGKSLITLGDSITYGAGVTDRTRVWGSLIARRNGMTFTNAGISGSTMGVSIDSENQNTYPCYRDERYLAVEGKDYAIIWFGWNDYNFCSLGTPDGTDETKTLVAYRLTLEHIIKNSPTTKVGVIIPYMWCWGDTDPQDHSIMDIINGIKAVCDVCGVPYLDINKFNFLQSWGSDYPNNEQYYIKWDRKQKVFTSDTLHPNEAGNEYLSTIIENFLRSL